MRARWFGQSAFLLTADKRVLIDPFGPLPPGRDWRFDYPPIEGVEADLLLRADFLGGPEEFLDRVSGRVERPGAAEVEVGELLGTREEPVVALLDPPG